MIEEKLKSMGIVLPEPPAPAGSYVPVTRAGNLLFISGQIPVKDGTVEFTGRVSEENIDAGIESARLCAINLMAQIKAEVGNLDRVVKVLLMSCFVNSGEKFTMHPKVINGASDLIYEVFGEVGRHSRMAVGVSSLPLDSMTEIGATVEVR